MKDVGLIFVIYIETGGFQEYSLIYRARGVDLSIFLLQNYIYVLYKIEIFPPQTRRRIVSWKFWNIFQPKRSPVGFTIYDKFCTPHQLIFDVPQPDTFIFKWFNHCVISLHHSYFISTVGIANL